MSPPRVEVVYECPDCECQSRALMRATSTRQLSGLAHCFRCGREYAISISGSVATVIATGGRKRRQAA